MKIVFEKENKNLVISVFDDYQEKIRDLETQVVVFGGKTFDVQYVLHCTMIDGAVANILTDTKSCSKCFICKKTPTEMNDMSVEKPPEINNYKYGMSSLHCWLRCFECLLHIAYKLPFKKWKVGKDHKTQLLEVKKKIQEQFRSEMGLIIDRVKSNFGTSNDGNTSRKFFLNFKKSAQITGIEEKLIYNLGLILRIISCGKSIEIKSFIELSEETRQIYLKHYSWYYMPSTLHKLLYHSSDIIQFFDLPIGNTLIITILIIYYFAIYINILFFRCAF